MTLRYLYCAVPAAASIDLAGWRGEGAPLEVILAGGVGGVLGHVPSSRYGARALARATADVRSVAPYALAHQAVVQFVFERSPAVVPVAFGSVHRTRADALRKLTDEAPRLRRLLRRFAGTAEWGLRITWRPRSGTVDPAAPGAGTAYLSARRAQLRDRATDPAALRVASGLAARIERLSLARVESAARDRDLVLRASYLVPAVRAARLRQVLAGAADRLADAGLAAELSGPWPAYSFARTEAARRMTA